MESDLASNDMSLFICIGLSVMLFFVGMFWEIVHHTRPGGRMKRGLPVWSRPLDAALVSGLLALPEQVETRWGWARRGRVDGGEVLLLRADPNQLGGYMTRRRSSWPYVALVYLDGSTPRISYRQPLLASLFVVPHLTLFFPMAPFVVLVAALNHSRQAPAIDKALAELSAGAPKRAASRGL